MSLKKQMEIFYMWIPSADPHNAAQTLRVQSLVWSGADGLAVQQNKISCNWSNAFYSRFFFKRQSMREEREHKIPVKSH